MKNLVACTTAVASLIASTASPAFADRTWILLIEESKQPINTKTYIDMQSVVVKDSVAYFNTGTGLDLKMPKDGFIRSAVMHCGKRTVGTGGSYVLSPLDYESKRYEGTWLLKSELSKKWDQRFNKQLEMVCPAEVLSKDWEEAQIWDLK